MADTMDTTIKSHLLAIDVGRRSNIRQAWDLVGKKVEKTAKLTEIWQAAEHSAALPHTLDCLAVESPRVLN